MRLSGGWSNGFPTVKERGNMSFLRRRGGSYVDGSSVLLISLPQKYPPYHSNDNGGRLGSGKALIDMRIFFIILPVHFCSFGWFFNVLVKKLGYIADGSQDGSQDGSKDGSKDGSQD